MQTVLLRMAVDANDESWLQQLQAHFKTSSHYKHFYAIEGNWLPQL